MESSQLDSFILQPKNIILNVSMSKGKISSFGDVATGLVALTSSGYLFSAPEKILLVLPIGILLILSLFLYLSTFIFFSFCSSHFIRELCQNAIIIASQPNSAYGGLFKILTMTLIPVGFLSYFPIEFIKKGNFFDFIVSLFGTLIFFNIACFLFRRGLKLYESGNLISKGL